MKKKYRLLKESDFQYLLKRGNKVYTKNFICYWKKNIEGSNIEIGIIIPKKKCRLSVNRKYYKRIFWSINVGILDDLPNIKCVFFYKDYFFESFSKNELTFDNLRREYILLMKNISNFKGL